MAKETNKKVERFRDTQNGRFTTEEYAKQHPNTTREEEDNVRGKKK